MLRRKPEENIAQTMSTQDTAVTLIENSDNNQQDADEASQSTAAEFFKSPNFYRNAQTYWSKIEPSVDGMLGGLSAISSTDIKGSLQFLNDLFKMKPSPQTQRALDCGAGIGRITKNVLINYFQTVDLVEQDENFVQKANEYLSSCGQIGRIHRMGLQDFTPIERTYDVIWCQWVLGHLTDDDLCAFLKRCCTGLTPNGCIVIKENFTSNDEDFCIDANDSSVTRSLRITKNILQNAELRIVKIVKQSNFIQGLFPVYAIACRPMRKL